MDYAEATVGPRFAYCVGWFMATLYTPALVSVLAWVSARYVCVLLGWDITGGACLALAGCFLCADYALNTLSPKLAGKLQVSATVVKMIPLVLMAVVGTILGLANGGLEASLATGSLSGAGGGLMRSTVAVAFAYEGWILTTTIHGELKNPKRNLPLALLAGALIVVATYVLYYVGLNGAVSTQELMAGGEAAAKLAFQRVFGRTAGTAVFVLIVLSCLGTLNGLMLANCRCFYALAQRGEGPKPELLREVSASTNMPSNSAAAGLAATGFWLLYFYGANLQSPGWFGPFCFDTSELPIITLYGMYAVMFLCFMKKERGLDPLRRFVLPALGLAGCLFMAYAAFAGYGRTVWFYLIIFAADLLLGVPFYRKERRR